MHDAERDIGRRAPRCIHDLIAVLIDPPLIEAGIGVGGERYAIQIEIDRVGIFARVFRVHAEIPVRVDREPAAVDLVDEQLDAWGRAEVEHAVPAAGAAREDVVPHIARHRQRRAVLIRDAGGAGRAGRDGPRMGRTCRFIRQRRLPPSGCGRRVRRDDRNAHDVFDPRGLQIVVVHVGQKALGIALDQAVQPRRAGSVETLHIGDAARERSRCHPGTRSGRRVERRTTAQPRGEREIGLGDRVRFVARVEQAVGVAAAAGNRHLNPDMRHDHARNGRAGPCRTHDVRRAVDGGRKTAIGQHLAGAVRIGNSRPVREFRAVQCGRAGDVTDGVSGSARIGQQDVGIGRVDQLHHQIGLVEWRSGLVDQGAERAFLQPVHPGDLDVVADIFVDEIDVVFQRARQGGDLGRSRRGRALDGGKPVGRSRAGAVIGVRTGRRYQRRGADRHCRQGRRIGRRRHGCCGSKLHAQNRHERERREDRSQTKTHKPHSCPRASFISYFSRRLNRTDDRRRSRVRTRRRVQLHRALILQFALKRAVAITLTIIVSP